MIINKFYSRPQRERTAIIAGGMATIVVLFIFGYALPTLQSARWTELDAAISASCDLDPYPIVSCAFVEPGDLPVRQIEAAALAEEIRKIHLSAGTFTEQDGPMPPASGTCILSSDQAFCIERPVPHPGWTGKHIPAKTLDLDMIQSTFPGYFEAANDR